MTAEPFTPDQRLTMLYHAVHANPDRPPPEIAADMRDYEALRESANPLTNAQNTRLQELQARFAIRP